jgi:hypothetical protein
VVVQLDEPSLPAVLAGRLPTPSGYGTVPAVEDADAQAALHTVLDAVPGPRIVHCCAANPPIELLRRAGADALGVDLLLVEAKAATTDAMGEAWDGGATLLLGVVPSLEPPTPITLRDAVRPAFELADRLGFPRDTLADRAVPTPTCGLAGATPQWARRVLALVRDAGRAFVEPPEGW